MIFQEPNVNGSLRGASSFEHFVELQQLKRQQVRRKKKTLEKTKKALLMFSAPRTATTWECLPSLGTGLPTSWSSWSWWPSRSLRRWSENTICGTNRSPLSSLSSPGSAPNSPIGLPNRFSSSRSSKHTLWKSLWLMMIPRRHSSAHRRRSSSNLLQSQAPVTISPVMMMIMNMMIPVMVMMTRRRMTMLKLMAILSSLSAWWFSAKLPWSLFPALKVTCQNTDME